MTGSVANTLWARSIVDELARAGVREVVVAPGSRSTPLVLAFASDDRIRLRVHLDERSAAFFALGVGKASGRPAAVVTTSGTAAANLLPAVIEASESEAPLLVLTADRPHRLRDSDANQAIDQVGLYGVHVRDFFHVAPPTVEAPALRHLRALVSRACANAARAPAGPVHLNVPFDKPLEPAEAPADFLREHPRASSGRPDGSPFVQVSHGLASASPAQLDELAELLASEQGVIVAGPSPATDAVGAAVLRLAARTGFPVLADPLSGARYGPCGGAYRVTAYDLFLSDVAVVERLEPSVILRVGSSPTSAALQRWMLHHDGVPHIVVDAAGRWKDHGAGATHYVRADAAATLTALSERADALAGDDWVALWRAAERATLDAIDELKDEPHEGNVLRAVVAATPHDSSLFVSSSMPVRDLDAFAPPREEALQVFGNRGASGIDGVVSTAFGVASQSEGPTLCVLGDVAFFHDQNGLLWSREDDAAVLFVLIDNDGGGIFHMLPIAEHEPHFTEYFATPHGLDMRCAAELHGIELRDTEVADVGEAVRAGLAEHCTLIVRVRTERRENHTLHVAVRKSVSRRVREALA